MNIILLIILILLIIGIINIRYSNFGNKQNIIPKIIHQTAPADKSKWHKDWAKCQDTWFKYFPDFEYKMWTDEDLDSFVKEHFPDFYDSTYNTYNRKIKKIDSARYCILYIYGGMYVDMDYLCFTNFWNLIPQDKISLCESPFHTHGEYLQNSLMITPPNEEFWLEVLKECTKRKDIDNPVSSTGPVLLTDVYKDNIELINPLPVDTYNPNKDVPDNKDMLARQLMTAVWL